MGSVEVAPVSSRRDRAEFLDFAWELYRGDPNWVPPLRHNQKKLLGFARHPFHEIAEMQTFLARKNGRVVGRIAAILNHNHNRQYGEQRGFFGFYESIDDQEVADSLFDAARRWLAERDIHELRGPVNPSMNYESGLLIEGFDSPPTFMMTYNQPYYARLFESYGFRKTHDLLAYFGEIQQLPEVEKRLGHLADQAMARSQATIRPMEKNRFRQEVELFLDLYNRSCTSMWGFVPLSPGELRQLAADLRHLLVPELAVVAMAEGRAVGVILGLPDYNPRIKAIDGRLLPFGFLKLLSRKKDIKRVRVVSINVLPEFQRWGLGLVLMRSLVPHALGMGICEAEFSWVSETNDLARMGLEKGGAQVYKTYRIYDYAGKDAPAT
ncbi:MAG: GNAT family N-acetyltransferase [Pirellulales bacterium]|nr:GNAT family N-acetyltransferase [Pirellulales bacterium]